MAPTVMNRSDTIETKPLNLPRWPVYQDDEIKAAMNVLESGLVNYWTGDECKSFEREFADYCGSRYAISLSNGSVALELALYALGIGEGDEVVVTPRSFIASASAIVLRGAIPVFADVDRQSQNITPNSIKEVLTKRTKAIIAVHHAGWPCDMPEMMKLASSNNIRVIEDCAQAHGASINGQKVGTFGDVAAFSFCQDKIMSTGGEGGMLLTSDLDIWQRAWSYKDHGKNAEKVFEQASGETAGFRWLHDGFGTNWRMTEMQAAIGRKQLKKLPNWLYLRRKYSEILNQKLSQLGNIRTSIPPSNIDHAYYKYYFFIKEDKIARGWHRSRIIEEINALGVPAFMGTCGEIYKELAFQHMSQHWNPKPIAKRLGETAVMLLVHPNQTEDDIYSIGGVVSSVLRRAAYSGNEA